MSVGEARGDLSTDAARLQASWEASGARVARLAPVFLEHGRPRAVSLPASAYDAAGTGCTTIAFLAGRSIDFVVAIDPVITPKHSPLGGHMDRSLAGSVTLVRCGPARDAFRRLSLELRVQRAAVEVIVAEAAGPAPAIAAALPERASGPVAPLADAGPRAPLEPLSVRAMRAETRALKVGATTLRHQNLTADGHGAGRESIRLEEGCHRIELFAEAQAKHPVDVDAELRDATSERLLARDRSDSPDARMDLCVGTTSAIDLVFAGAPADAPVLLHDALFPLPLGLPGGWGARARAGLAAAMFRRKLPALASEPIDLKLGTTGVTPLRIPVEPGSCYVAAVAATAGDPRAIMITAKVDAKVAFDANGGLIDGSAVAFCSEVSDRATLEVEVRGVSAAWLLAVWQVARRPLGEGQ
jgi:hypothetical protein